MTSWLQIAPLKCYSCIHIGYFQFYQSAIWKVKAVRKNFTLKYLNIYKRNQQNMKK